MNVVVSPLICDDVLRARYRGGRYGVFHLIKSYLKRFYELSQRHEFDLVWIEKEALPWMPLWLERKMLRGVPYVLDFDDATFHNYDQHSNFLARRFFGRRLDGLMAGAALVVSGNEYLASRARSAGAPLVEILPTVVDLRRYVVRENHLQNNEVPTIVWIGSPSTVRYLCELGPALKELARRADFKLRVIGASIEISGVEIECLEWTEASEVDLISSCDIGIMPLRDSSWERGKCGYKLIQYMACGLPTVASGVGANLEIVSEGVSGFIADTPDEWIAGLLRLLKNAPLRKLFGEEGRKAVEEKYCLEVAAPRLAKLFLVARGRGSVSAEGVDGL